MDFTQHLAARQDALVSTWLESMFSFYPTDSQRFFLQKKDRFHNPIGHTFQKEVVRIFAALLTDDFVEAAKEPMDEIVRIMAIQDFPPSRALRFLFLLKPLIREEGRDGGYPPADAEALIERIDELILAGFDIYSKRRDKVWELRANAYRNQTSALLRRANLLQGPFSEGSGSGDIHD